MSAGRGLANLMLMLASIAVAALFMEGVAAWVRGDRPDVSLAMQAYEWAEARFFPGKALDPAHPRNSVLEDVDEIEALLPLAKRYGVGFGNTPYASLDTDEASVLTTVNGCKRNKPGVRRIQSHLRELLFEPMDPATVFWDPDRTLDPKLTTFIERYGFHFTTMTIDSFGDRVTLPVVDSDRVVLVVGDSVANGALIGDDETLASQLQATDLDRKYVNTGISSASAAEVICAAEQAARNYSGKLEELIYVMCENDFKRSKPYGSPEEVVDWIEKFAREQDIEKVTIVFAPYFYNIIPEITRIRGTDGYDFPNNSHRRRRLVDRVAETDFRFVDFTDIALEENERAGTMFAAFALFVDRVHHSRYGVSRLAEVLRSQDTTPDARAAAAKTEIAAHRPRVPGRHGGRGGASARE